MRLDAILVTQSDESRTSYGTSIAVHDGLPFFGDFGIDVDGIPQPPLDWVNVDTRFETVSGPLLQQTLETNAAGEVTGSLYLYEGGTFVMEFDLYNSVTGETRNGLFVAPIIGPIRVTATEDSDFPSIPATIPWRWKRVRSIPHIWDGQSHDARTHRLGGGPDRDHQSSRTSRAHPFRHRLSRSGCTAPASATAFVTFTAGNRRRGRVLRGLETASG